MPITRSLPLCRRTFVTDLAFNLIMDCGQAMLANGGEVFRAQDTMEIMARSFGIVDFHVYVLTNGIFASAQNGTVGALMVLTPGVALTMGIRDIINSDYLSGTIRLVDALLVAGCLAVGVTLGYTLLSTVTGVVW